MNLTDQSPDQYSSVRNESLGEELLQVNNLVTKIQTGDGVVQVVNGVNLTVGRGEIVALVGESGSGKSMTINSILQTIPNHLLAGYSGMVRFEGRDLLQISQGQLREIRGNRISIVFQNAMTALDPSYPVGAQVVEVLVKKAKYKRQEARERALILLQQVGISDPLKVYRSYPHQLSGGLRQRAVIAISLACGPSLLIADEPTSALDPTVQLQVLDLFQEINERLGTAILLITHDFGVVSRIAHKVAVMHAGQIIEEGTVQEVVFEPQHPYTQNLLQCVPDLHWIFRGEKKRSLAQIPGEPPRLPGIAEGCPFVSRCMEAEEKCFQQTPDLTILTDCHLVRCWKREGA